jgi:hypothetical protein
LFIWNLVHIDNDLVSFVVSSVFLWLNGVESDQHDVDEADDVEVDPGEKVPLVCEDLQSVRDSAETLLPFHFDQEHWNLFNKTFKFFLLGHTV